MHPIGLAFRVPNSREGLKQLKRRLAGLPVVLIVMEATGKLHREAHRNLNDSGFAVAVVNPLRSRLFAKAMGQLAKTDKVDARMLALMGAMLEPKAKPPAPEALESFQELVRGRDAFVRERTALLNQLGAAKATFLKQQIRRQIRTIEAAIGASRRRSRASSRPTRGWPGAMRSSSRSKASVPSPRLPYWPTSPRSAPATPSRPPCSPASPPSPTTAATGQARAASRADAPSCAPASTWPPFPRPSSNPGLKAFYDRLVAAGKLPKVALTAVMRKLIVLANTLIREDRLWKPKHAPAHA